MAYCGPRGIPLSVFLGRVVGTGDPEWLPEDREAALGWSAYEGQRCSHCGTHPDEWADDRFAYHAHLTECRGCKQQQRLADTDEAKKGEGRYAVMASGSAADCPRCKPISIGAAPARPPQEPHRRSPAAAERPAPHRQAGRSTPRRIAGHRR